MPECPYHTAQHLSLHLTGRGSSLVQEQAVSHFLSMAIFHELLG